MSIFRAVLLHLTYLLEICEGLVLPLHDGCHPTQGCPLELFATVKRVTILHQTNVVTSNVVHKVTGCVDLETKIVCS